jgi:Domain of unknown function (DUF222)
MTAEAGDEGRGAGPGGEAAVPARGDLLDGLLMSWSGDVPLDDLLAAARRQLRQRAGGDVPAWEEPDAKQPDAKQSDVQRPEGRDAQRSAHHSHDPDRKDPQEAHGRSDPHDLDAEDRYGDDELLAAELAASSAMPPGTPGSDPAGSIPGGSFPGEATTAGALPAGALPAGTLAGHARLTPGPALAGWLSGASPDVLDDAALVNSVTGWRKVTSWAQAQELAAIAELGCRRGVTREVAPDRTPVEELAADFAPNEVALALTLTQCAADYWMTLAVSLASRLPATLAALRSGKIDLGRAKLIDQFTTPLDSELAGKVEGRVLAKAEHQTTGQLRASLQRAVISVDPEAAERRRKQAERNARVELTGEPEGTASLFGRYLPAAQAAAAWTRSARSPRPWRRAGRPGASTCCGLRCSSACCSARRSSRPVLRNPRTTPRIHPARLVAIRPRAPAILARRAAIHPRALVTLACRAAIHPRALVALACRAAIHPRALVALACRAVIHPRTLVTLAHPAVAHLPAPMAMVPKTGDHRTVRARAPTPVPRRRPAPVARILVRAARPPPITSHPAAAPTPLDVHGLVFLPWVSFPELARER